MARLCSQSSLVFERADASRGLGLLENRKIGTQSDYLLGESSVLAFLGRSMDLGASRRASRSTGTNEHRGFQR